MYTTFDAFVNEKMYEVAPNVMIIPSYGAYFWVANKAWFDAQPAADRKLMDDDRRRSWRKQYDKDIWADDGRAHRQTVKKGGGKVSDPAKDPAARKAFRAALGADLRQGARAVRQGSGGLDPVVEVARARRDSVDPFHDGGRAPAAVRWIARAEVARRRRDPRRVAR